MQLSQYIDKKVSNASTIDSSITPSNSFCVSIILCDRHLPFIVDKTKAPALSSIRNETLFPSNITTEYCDVICISGMDKCGHVIV